MLNHENAAAEEWATLHFKLKDEDWSYMNHSATVRTSTNLAVIKGMLKRKHGPIANLNIFCKDEYLEKNEFGRRYEDALRARNSRWNSKRECANYHTLLRF